MISKKGKVHPVTFCEVTEGHRGTNILFLQPHYSMGIGCRSHVPGHFIPEKDHACTVQEGGGMGGTDLTPTIVQTPNHPAHSESLHQLHYPSPKTAVSYDDNIT
jgi:hypothetical protein